MSRLLLILGALLGLLALVAGATALLAYGTGAERSGTLDVAGLPGSVDVAWDAERRVWVEAADEAGLAAGLGYAHAADHGWAASLWRQAARGELAEWFGDDARPLDLHARTLGFGDLARQTYDALDGDGRALLEAYAAGASAAFAEPGVAQGDAFLVADVVPEGWAPWDALAVERLHAYLATNAPAADSTWRRAARGDSAVAAFLAADVAFREFLGVPGGGGFDRAYTLGGDSTSADTSGAERVLVHQLAAGTSALAALAPAVLRTPERSAVALTIPGTLVSPGGIAEGAGWALVLGSDLRLEPYAGPAPPAVYSRVVERDGDETLLAVTRDADGLVLTPGRAGETALPDPTVAPDSAASGSGWRVRWQGFAVGTDLGAFRALRAGRAPGRFTLFDGAGLRARSGALDVMGSPRVALTAGAARLVAQDSLVRSAAAVLAPSGGPPDTLGRAPLRPVTAVDREVTSAWARDRLPDLIAALGARDSLAEVLQAPYAYLNGWDGAYRADGIAPSLFEWWLASHRDLTGHLPDLSDTLDVALLPSSLRIARAELRDRYGPLPTGWRWGRLQGGPRYPVLGAYRSAAARAFRDPLGPPGGHPTTLLPGPSVVLEASGYGLAVWTVRTDLASGRVAVASPRRRPAAVGALDIDGETERDVLFFDADEPMPADRLRLTPLVL